MNLSKTKDMKKIENQNIKRMKSENWKANSQNYLKELQSFLDKAENIQNEDLKKEIIFQMLKCDNELTVLAEEMFETYYLKGKNLIREDSEEDD